MRIRWILYFTVLVFACITSSAGAAGGVSPKKPSDIVTLDTTLGFVDPQPPCPTRSRYVNAMILADDTVVPFVIPEGNVFVITSADFYAELAVADRNYEFQLVGTGPGGPLVVANGRADASGQVTGVATVPTGVVIKPNVSLCANAGSLSVPQIPSFVRVHGFFTKDK